MSVLSGQRVVLRPATSADAPVLAAIVAEPDVARWWPDYDPVRMEAHLRGGGGAVPMVVELEGEPIGMIQWWEEDDPTYRHAGMDLFLTTRRHGAGLGREAVSLLARYLIEERGHHRLVIDPALENEVAVRCYEAAGFRRVGVMHRYERSGDGSWRDGLLMELVVDET